MERARAGEAVWSPRISTGCDQKLFQVLWSTRCPAGTLDTATLQPWLYRPQTSGRGGEKRARYHGIKTTFRLSSEQQPGLQIFPSDKVLCQNNYIKTFFFFLRPSPTWTPYIGILPSSLLSTGTNSFHRHQLNRNFGKLSKITPCFLFAFNALFTQFLCDFSRCFQFTRNTLESCSGSCACGSGCFASMILWVLYSDFYELTFLSTAHFKEEISWILN